MCSRCPASYSHVCSTLILDSIHDGWGLSDNEKGNAVKHGDTTHMDAIRDAHNFVPLEAHGLAVGLKEGLMGNSEVGHLNIGAGRIVWQDIVKIDQSIKKGEFKDAPNIVAAMDNAKKGNGRLHLLGLISDGGVHAHINHLFELLKVAKAHGIPHVYIHFFGDGRDTAPKSASNYLGQLLDFIDKEKVGEVSTIVGRYYAMDRDKRWERIKIAVDGLVKGEGEKSSDPRKTVEQRYEAGETDEFLKPIICGSEDSRIKDNDTLFFFNYRSDRVREICTVFGLPDKPMEVTVPSNLDITTMTRYNAEFPFKIAFPPGSMDDVLAEWLSKQGIKQCHVAETEKYAHVTFFFNGGVEKQFKDEDRVMIPSPKVPTYDKQPEMSAQGVADKVAEIVKSNKYEFVMCNFAPPDMVGHTGVFDAAVKAISATDAAVKTIYDAVQENPDEWVLLITADHGNAEQMLDPDTGNPHTAHTTNPVPFILTGDKGAFEVTEKEGSLGDVAPTILELMGLPKPEAMTGRSLLVKK